ncbi:MAG: sulfite exporter TauE/SafE family protein, partial [Halalkalicoccus sp.]
APVRAAARRRRAGERADGTGGRVRDRAHDAGEAARRCERRALGVGGGFLLMPAMVYGLGVPAAVAVGTDTVQITISGAFGTFAYARAGAVSLPAVAALLAGSALGARIGAGATTLVDEDGIKGYFAAMLLAGSLSVAANELGVRLGIEALEAASVLLVFGATVLVSGAIVLAAICRLRRPAGQWCRLLAS